MLTSALSLLALMIVGIILRFCWAQHQRKRELRQILEHRRFLESRLRPPINFDFSEPEQGRRRPFA